MRRIVSVMILTLLVGAFMLAFNMGLVRAQVPAQTPTVTIVNPLSPTNSSLFEFNSSASLINSTFTAAVYISTVTNMDAWQVMMTWNNSIINYATVWVPTDNVFEPAVDNGATLNGPFSATSAPFSVAPNTGYLTVGCSTFDLSNSPPLYPVNVSGEGLLFDVNFTIASIPNATQTLSTNLGIILSNPYVLGYLESFVVIYPSTTETAVLAESATMTIVGPQVTSSTVYINSDGSVSPSDAPISSVDNVTYTFTGNMSYPTYNGIVVERNNIVIDGNGYTVQGNYSNGLGISLTGVNDVTIENCDVKGFGSGIQLSSSSNDTVSNNNVTANVLEGISLLGCSNDTVSGNNATANGFEGIYLGGCSNDTVCGNNATGNGDSGIELGGFSTNNIVSGNNVAANLNGIFILHSANNTFIGNNATGNSFDGIYLYASSDNIIYHNNFVGNAAQVSIDSTSVRNAWDDGYPSGGNYWSDYNGTDLYSGPYQNVTGSDGIGDTPYVINANNTDHYPLMYLWVVIPGDVNQDGRVDMADVTLVVNAFGSYPGHPRWNPACDFNGSGKVDLADLVIVLMNFGKHESF